nr:PREDICTED: ciliary neurotrophic factor [Lepisosteus oculatus]
MDLGDDLPADRVDGVPPSSSLAQDGPVSERLKLVSVALRSLHVLLGAVVLEQQEEFSPADGAFHSKLEALLSRLGDLSDGLGLLLLETGGVTAGDKDAPPSSPSASSSSSFSRKVRGYCVLRELSAWALRAHQELRSGGAGTGGNAEGSGAPGGRRAQARRLRHRRI